MKSLLKLFVLTLFVAGQANALNFDEAFEKLSDNFKNKLETFSADVTQEVKIADVSETQVLSGTVTIKKPDKLFLEYTAPVKQNVISDGKSLWIFFKEQNQVIVQDVSEEKAKDNIIFQLPKYLEFLKEKYIGSIKEEEKYGDQDTILFEFVPKTQNEDFTKITLLADKKDWLPISSTVYLGDSNTITVKFYNIVANKAVEDSLFDFKVPEGAENITSLLQ